MGLKPHSKPVLILTFLAGIITRFEQHSQLFSTLFPFENVGIRPDYRRGWVIPARCWLFPLSVLFSPVLRVIARLGLIIGGVGTVLDGYFLIIPDYSGQKEASVRL